MKIENLTINITVYYKIKHINRNKNKLLQR